MKTVIDGYICTNRGRLAHQFLAWCAPIFAFLMLAQGAARAATVVTDQEDYPPFSVVYITGAGFQAGETVSNQVVQVAGPDAGAAYDPWGVVADSNGGFETTWLVFSDELLNTTLELTTIGQSSGLVAKKQFTDANPQILTISAQSPSPISPGGIATYTTTLNFGGNNNLCTVTQSVSGLPAGATASFSPDNESVSHGS